MEMASFWKNRVHGGYLYMLSVTLGIGTIIFTDIEGLSTVDAIYASMITGKNILGRVYGYLDLTMLTLWPKEQPWDMVIEPPKQI